MSSSGVALPVPEDITRASTPPIASARSSTTAPPVCGSVRSSCRTWAVAPSARTSSAVRSAPSSSVCQVRPTSRPGVASATAVARPIPESAPVTMTRRGSTPCSSGSGRAPLPARPGSSVMTVLLLRSPGDELEERAVLAARLLLLVEEGQVLLLELGEPVLPADVLQVVRAGAAGEVDAQHPGCVPALGSPDTGRLAVVVLDPPADLVVVRGGRRLRCHRCLLTGHPAWSPSDGRHGRRALHPQGCPASHPSPGGACGRRLDLG